MSINCGLNENASRCIKTSSFPSNVFCDVIESTTCKTSKKIKEYKTDLKLFFTSMIKNRLSNYNKNVETFDIKTFLSVLPSGSLYTYYDRFPQFIKTGILNTYRQYIRNNGATEQSIRSKQMQNLENIIIINTSFPLLDKSDIKILHKLKDKLKHNAHDTQKLSKSTTKRVLPHFITSTMNDPKKQRSIKLKEEKRKKDRELAKQRKVLVKKLQEEEKRKKDRELAKQRKVLVKKLQEKEKEDNMSNNMTKDELDSLFSDSDDDTSVPSLITVSPKKPLSAPDKNKEKTQSKSAIDNNAPSPKITQLSLASQTNEEDDEIPPTLNIDDELSPSNVTTQHEIPESLDTSIYTINVPDSDEENELDSLPTMTLGELMSTLKK